MTDRIGKAIADFIETSPLNSLTGNGGIRAWDTPLVGVSLGDDPLHVTIARDIGSFHQTPLEAYRAAFPADHRVTASELSVIVWILPQTVATKKTQRRQRLYPSEHWVRARIYGEQFNDSLRRHVVQLLERAGFPSAAPVLSATWRIHNDTKYGLASTWSERHAAYVSGLGTFGLCDGLITPLGKAVRIGAVGKDGHDKRRCNGYIGGPAAGHAEGTYGLGRGGCGLCQSAVPCESGIPMHA